MEIHIVQNRVKYDLGKKKDHVAVVACFVLFRASIPDSVHGLLYINVVAPPSVTCRFYVSCLCACMLC